MPEVILPCPACGSTDCECLVCTINADESQTIHFHMACNKCFTSGPIADDAESAKILWNTLPRALRWTHEPPKVAGKYWWRPSGKKIGRIRDMFVRNGEVGFLDRNDRFIKDTGDGEWAGPIALPVE